MDDAADVSIQTLMSHLKPLAHIKGVQQFREVPEGPNRWTIYMFGSKSRISIFRNYKVKPEEIYLGSKKHGIDWGEGPSTAKKTGKPQGQWGSTDDLEVASEIASDLPDGASDYFQFPDDHTSVVHFPDGTTKRATHMWIKNKGTGKFHGYPLIK